MTSVLKEESTITAKGQTTVPKSVRQALGVDYGGRITFTVDAQRRVIVEKVEDEAADPVVGSFLNFLAQDMAANPQRSIVPLTPELRSRVAALVDDLESDPGETIDGETVL
ncbi:type II toxin-antitoxin system PrlF family antitoxin [Devosia sp. WQ 349]|uniref:type II toxin-antitoxin system PrlF family antitoxin n=1 Tax=Devosia sp. WQ 349K1 TaxID=2800329 RepID=UPI00190528EC|nr:type II toxin-antitoxin system PrlF family antitoxin [Devosia sp. WQ 349K1]MBK1793868.1 type II toxin-antitoxin system PrlF family antitoxin [Devosia sp. WQ 349K1]